MFQNGLARLVRSEVTFEQAQLAREHGFRAAMYFVTPGSVEECVRRIKARAYRGGHAASETRVREIFHKSARNLLTALDFHSSGMDRVEIYDNSVNLADQRDMSRIMSIRKGRASYLAPEVPDWLENLLKGTRFDIEAVREFLSSW